MSENPSVLKMQAMLHAAETAPDAERQAILDAIAGMSDEEVLGLAQSGNVSTPRDAGPSKA